MDNDYIKISRNMARMMDNVDQIGTAEYFLVEHIFKKIQMIIDNKATNPIEMPKTKKWRKAVTKMIDFKELCNVPMNDVFVHSLMKKEHVDSYDILYLFDLLRSGDLEKLANLMTLNKNSKFEVDKEGKTLLHIAAMNC